MANSPDFALFDTPLGACALAWNSAGVVGVWLPGADAAATRERVLRRHAGARETEPPPGIAEAMAAIAALLAGEPRDLAGVRLDLATLSDFDRRACEAARAIPSGAVLTYGELAARMGESGAAQAVGRAMAKNPCPILVPCHRVVAAGDRLHGFSAPGGLATKRRLLEIEGGRRRDGPDLFDTLG